jgi:hypothetical protein
MTPVKAALAGGLLLIAAALAVVLSRAPAEAVFARSVPAETQLVATSHDIGGCERGELLPSGTTAIRLGLFGVTSPEVDVRVTSGPRLVASGALAPGWSGEGATMPVAPLPRPVSPATICFRMKSVTGEVTMVGRKTPPSEATVGGARPLPGRISIEYLHPGKRSWASLAGSIARHLGLGRSSPGIWNAFFVLALAIAVAGLSSWVVVRDLR